MAAGTAIDDRAVFALGHMAFTFVFIVARLAVPLHLNGVDGPTCFIFLLIYSALRRRVLLEVSEGAHNLLHTELAISARLTLVSILVVVPSFD